MKYRSRQNLYATARAAATAACLARGLNLEESVGAAKRFVTEAIRRAPGLGRGHGPVNHAVAAQL